MHSRISQRLKGLLGSEKRRQQPARLELQWLEERFAPALYTVINTADGGAGSLRDAINQSNANPPPAGAPGNVIEFNIPNQGAVQLITLDPTLPQITVSATVTIDGLSQGAGGNMNWNSTPWINIDCSGFAGDGLDVSGTNIFIQGLAIYNCGGDGIDILSSADNTTVQFCNLGTNTAVSNVTGNAGNGISVFGSDNEIRNCVLSGNTGDGVLLAGATAVRNQVYNCDIGVDSSGNTKLSNGGNGVEIRAGANGNFIGSTDTNYISGNGGDGVRITNSQSNQVMNNLIGIAENGVAALPNAGNGVRMELGASNNTIGSGLCCRSPSKTCVSAYYYPVPATGLTLGRMVLTLAFECWVFADYLPSSFVRGRLASLTSQLVTALHPIDSVVPLTFALAPSASSTCRLCPGCLLVLMPSGPAATALRSPRTNSPPLHAKSHTPTCPAGRRAGDHRPDSLAPLPALFAARPLRDVPVDHHEADRLLGQVVRRFYPRRGDEREIGVSVLAKPLRHVLAVPRRRGGQAQPYYRVARLFQPAAETPPCCVARVDGTPRTASSVPPAMLRRSCGRADRSGNVVRNFTSRIRWARQNCTVTPH